MLPLAPHRRTGVPPVTSPQGSPPSGRHEWRPYMVILAAIGSL